MSLVHLVNVGDEALAAFLTNVQAGLEAQLGDLLDFGIEVTS